jgi:adenosylcobinamide-GDP ribazoletransferase
LWGCSKDLDSNTLMFQPFLLLNKLWGNFLGSIVFYTVLYIPPNWRIVFEEIAAFAPLIGVGIGIFLSLSQWSLSYVGMPVLSCSAVVVGLGIFITGGLHLDGVIDTADGLAVTNSDRRLEVMGDSQTGAYGVMAGVLVIVLKVCAVYDLLVIICFSPSSLSNSLNNIDFLFLMAGAGGWGRWGQLLAIFCYPYLRSQGKGDFHKKFITSIWNLVPATLLLVFLGIAQILIHPSQWILAVAVLGLGGAIATGVGAYFNYRFGGHTGDTYGAVVEWTEALMLCSLTIVVDNLQ